MRATLAALLALLPAVAAAAVPQSIKPTALPRDPRDIAVPARLSMTKASADIDGDGAAEALVLITALTGESDPVRAADVVLAVAEPRPGEQRGPLLWVRHVLEETGRPAHDGELTAVDLDGDGHTELILSWDRSLTAEKVERVGEVWRFDGHGAPRRVWDGELEVDTRRDRQTPAPERQRFKREIDFGATRREAGRAIVFNTVHSMAAGRALDPPRRASERVEAALRQ